MNNGFKDLLVWQDSYKLSLSIYKITTNFPKTETYGLISQMRSCSSSVPANISEGYERKSRKEYLYFLRIAKGSLGELETFLLLSRDLEYINRELWQELENLRCRAIKLLRGLIKSLSSTPALPNYSSTRGKC